jgi:hypothetical protein
MKKVFMVCAALGLIAVSPAGLVDDFEGYSTGNLGNVASPPWTSVGNLTSSNVLIGEEADENGYFAYFAAGSSVIRGGYRSISAIANDNTATTLFLRFYTETATFNNTFGLSAKSAPGAFDDMNVMMRVNAGKFDVRSGGVFTEGVAIQSGIWYNVWAVIDQSTDTFDVYLTSGLAGAAAADKVAAGAAFRVGTADSLVSVVALVQGYTGAPAANKVRLDDIYLFDGVVLSNPIPEPATLLALGLGSVLLRKRK